MKLHLYFAKRFIRIVGMLFLAFAILNFLLDLVEQLRLTGGSNVPLSKVVTLVIANLPSQLYQFLPLIIVLASIGLFIALSRSSELVITRAVGRSAIRSLLGPTLAAVLIGVLAITAFNPLVASTKAKYDRMFIALTDAPTNVFSFGSSGLWLRQGNAEEQVVISAERSNSDGTLLFAVTLYGFGAEGDLGWRMEAARAQLFSGYWELSDATFWQIEGSDNPETSRQGFPTYKVETDLTKDHIEDNFGAPSAISFWQLPRFITRLENAGFSAKRHIVWFHQQIALPMFMGVLVLLVAAFTMRHSRIQSAGLMILLSLMTSFGLYFVRNFAQILAENNQMAPLLAAWLPVFVGFGVGMSVLFHTEDG